MILRGVKADQPHCSLRIFEGHRGFRFYLTVVGIPCVPEFGTRYFKSTHVMPFDVSQSQTSVPSRSIART